MNQLPTKITPDAIREALFEVRFEHDELAELALGALAGNPAWKGFAKARLPSGGVPEQVRESEPALRYLPSIELRASGGGELVRLGSNIVTHHVVGDYIGWDSFLPKLVDTARFLIGVMPSIRASRFGLRYINALTESEHFVSGVFDLNLRIEVGSEQPSNDVHLAYTVEKAPDLNGFVRIVSPIFVEGSIPPSTVAVIDIDIFTDSPKGMCSAENVQEWLERAHQLEKESFFRLLRPETITRLTEH